MKRYLFNVAASLLVFTVLYIGLYYGQLGRPTESSRWIHEISQYKIAAATQATPPRVLVLSGSSGHFGIRARDIARAIDIPAFNMSAQASLGKYMLEEYLRRFARPGDIIIVPFEYAFYTNSKWDPVAMDYIMSRDPGYFRSMPLHEKANFMMNTPVARIIRGYLAPQSGQSPYHVSSLNEVGDETSNISTALTNSRLDGFLPYPKEKFKIDNEALQRLADTIAWAQSQNIALVASFPAFLKFDVYGRDEDFVNFFHSVEEFWNDHSVPVIGTPDEFMYGKEDMYDTHYHTNDQGMGKRTVRIIDGLEKLFASGRLNDPRRLH